eukprot:TRINITY_DN18092_c0_g1_i1.p1 TRINITY_DN18092_c0_g1~~TRINITY_DN18092_c0_g1_i1.p1  ORF type:complete len:164 (+),score=34.25 TRINITY_DN18092_c0_g1_i1:255-746(+)
MTRLVLKNLVKTYNGRKVVNGVDIMVNQGEVTGLLGPNGAGKTTTFYMAVGMINPDKGQVFLDRKDITDYPMYMRARSGIGYLPQEASIFRKLTVRQNITAILEVRPDVETNIDKKADRLMKELGIYRLADQKASVLSGGERRRLEISRVLSTDPLFLSLIHI